MPTEELLLTPEEWSKRTGIVIQDPDGWRNTGLPFNVPITRAEFIYRAKNSTTRKWPEVLYDEREEKPKADDLWCGFKWGSVLQHYCNKGAGHKDHQMHECECGDKYWEERVVGVVNASGVSAERIGWSTNAWKEACIKAEKERNRALVLLGMHKATIDYIEVMLQYSADTRKTAQSIANLREAVKAFNDD